VERKVKIRNNLENTAENLVDLEEGRAPAEEVLQTEQARKKGRRKRRRASSIIFTMAAVRHESGPPVGFYGSDRFLHSFSFSFCPTKGT
jgi:hypothetical protein